VVTTNLSYNVNIFHNVTKIIAIIPARSGSKSIKNKNLKKIKGVSLLVRAIKFAKKIKIIDKVIVTTDSRVYQKIARNNGADCPFLRPKKYALDNSLDIEAFYHCLNWLKKKYNYNSDICINLRPTYPVRKVKDFIFAINKIKKNRDIDSVKSICKIPFPLEKTWIITKDQYLKNSLKHNSKELWNYPRQKLPSYYVQNGNIDIVRSKVIFQKKKMSGLKIYPVIQNHFYDIDNLKDLKLEKKFKNF
jgi:CMP-N,N'-diacetyllegionaminic acid synthase